MFVSSAIQRDMRVITLSDGKVNTLGAQLRADLLGQLDAAAADKGCRAVIIVGKGPSFCAGADLKELQGAVAFKGPKLHTTIFDAIEAMPVPVIAALHGTVLGGGMELALGCHYRIALPDTLLGLPEVQLGLMPGAGGTVRLPRAVGVETALNLILSGKTYTAAKAPEGLIDRIVEGDLLDAAIAFAGEVADRRPIPLLDKKPISHPNIAGFAQFARGAVARDPRRAPGLVPIIDAVERAVTMPAKKAREIEFTTFQELSRDPASLPFRHAFLSERKTASVPGLGQPRAIETAAVIGAGTMGAGIAIALAEAGIPVRILDLNPEALERGLAHCAKTWDRGVAKGRMDQAKRQTLVARVTAASDYAEIAQCDLVIEAVVEQMPVKQAVFKTLDEVMKPGAVLGTNTSTLDVDAIASATKRPEDVVGLHFFSPANIMKLLEIVRGAATSGDALATGLALAKRLRKVPVVAGNCDGFIGNRMVDQYIAQAMYLVEEGATPAQVDAALTKWGMAMGPFAMSDVVGNDVPWMVRKAKRVADPDIILPRLPDALCEEGWFGQKTGKGWYLYGGKRPSPNPDLPALIDAVRAEQGITPRKISDTEIVERCIFALVNVAAAILDEGYAQRGSDIDIAYLYGYGFPRFRGGPLYFADDYGLTEVARRMRDFAETARGKPGFWEPHPLILRCAKDLSSISSFEVPK